MQSGKPWIPASGWCCCSQDHAVSHLSDTERKPSFEIGLGHGEMSGSRMMLIDIWLQLNGK